MVAAIFALGSGALAEDYGRPTAILVSPIHEAQVSAATTARTTWNTNFSSSMHRNTSTRYYSGLCSAESFAPITDIPWPDTHTVPYKSLFHPFFSNATLECQ